VNYDDADLTGYYLPHAAAILSRYERVFSHLERFVGTSRFLDIGAGMGFSLQVARRRGWAAQGLEPNRTLAQYAQREGLNVVNAYLGKDTGGSFEVVLMDNVLEHILDPLDFMRDAARLLAPDGIIVVAIPPLDWLRQWLCRSAYVRARVMHPQLNVFREVDEHVNMFSRKAMHRLLHAVGLDLLDMRFHHSRVFDNVLFRGLGLDDGYYFITRR